MDTLQSSFSGYLACQVTSFTNGSIITDIDMYFTETSNATEGGIYNATSDAFEGSNVTITVISVEG